MPQTVTATMPALYLGRELANQAAMIIQGWKAHILLTVQAIVSSTQVSITYRLLLLPMECTVSVAMCTRITIAKILSQVLEILGKRPVLHLRMVIQCNVGLVVNMMGQTGTCI